MDNLEKLNSALNTPLAPKHDPQFAVRLHKRIQREAALRRYASSVIIIVSVILIAILFELIHKAVAAAALGLIEASIDGTFIVQDPLSYAIVGMLLFLLGIIAIILID